MTDRVSGGALREMKWWATTGQFNRFPALVPAETVRIIIEEVLNDKNSSSYREDMTLKAVGLTQNPNKLGSDAVEGPYEVKPQNVMLDQKKKLNGGGNFTDFTWARHHKYLGDRVDMLISGFVNGRLVYVMEFPYVYLIKRVTEQLTRRFPDGDVTNQYLRSASFTFKSYHDEWLEPRVRWLEPDFQKFQSHLTKPLYKFLEAYDRSKITLPLSRQYRS